MHTTLQSRLILPLIATALAATQLSAQATMQHPAATTAAAPTDAQKAFAIIKSVAGSWQGTIVEPISKTKMPMEISLRVTSRGNSVVHEMKGAGVADDPAKYDHPVTMFYLQGNELLLTHFCDAGNRPRMTAAVSPDGKTVDFSFLDLTGPTEHGHMHHVTFTVVDADHHTETWTYMAPGDKPMKATVELTRVATVATAAPAK